LSLRDVGHRLPTGDPFRQLVLEACAAPTPDPFDGGVEPCDEALDSWRFTRTIVVEDGGLREASDSSLTPGEVRTIELPQGAARWQLRYLFAEPGLQVPGAPDESGVELASGLIH
jgi:hypothetical protein